MAARNANFSDEPSFSSDQHRNRRSKETPRSIEFRRKKNKETMQNIKNELDIKLFKTLGGIEQFSKTINFSAQSRSVQVPITTRGIGLLTNQTIIRTSQVLPAVTPPIPALYRTALAQCEAKISIANASQNQLSVRETAPPTRLPIELQNAIVARPRQLSSVAAVINQIGNVTVNETCFSPRLTTKTHFNLTLSNLRAYVESMSVLNTPLVERQRGYQLNSIPSAVWDCDLALDPDGHPIPGQPNPLTLRIMNPDYVIQAGYAMADLIQDFRDVDVYFERLGRKMMRSIDNVEFVDSGYPSQLVSTIARRQNAISLSSRYDNNGTVVLRSAEGDADEWYNQRCLATQDNLMGIIGLIGEVDLEMPGQLMAAQDSFRTPYGAVQAFDQSWLTTVESML